MRKQSDYFNNIGGLNVTDSPFFVREEQATGGNGFEYPRTGGVSKSWGALQINTAADTQLKSLGLGLYNTSAGSKSVLRVAGTKLQVVDIDLKTFTNKSEDTAATNSNFFSSSSTVPAMISMYTAGNTDIAWVAGAGASSIYGYTGTSVTKNGATSPTGTLSTAVVAGSSTFASTGTYYYAIAYRKASTQAISNASLDASATIAATTNKVNLTFPAAPDTTKYDKIYIYRSAVSGVSGFTTGDLVTTVNSNVTTYSDTGTSTSSSIQIPRSGNLGEDHSELASATYKNITTWKNRLVAITENTVNISEFNQSEYWPLNSDVTVPSGGDITACGIVGFNTPTSFNTDEKLCLWKQSELWEVSGTGFYDDTLGLYDYTLKFVDKIGCPSQSLVVQAFGNIFWLNTNGIYMWSGSGKPIRISRPIEALFASDGDIDKSKLTKGFGVYYAKENKIYWILSDKIHSENTFIIKLDLRLTMLKRAEQMGETFELDGVFTTDLAASSLYSGLTYLPSTPDELFISGDASGYLYKMYADTANPNTSAIEFSYYTKNYDMGLPGLTKDFIKVIVWLDDLSVTDDLRLNYWTDLKSGTSDQSQIDQSMDFDGSNNTALYNVGIFDESEFDSYSPSIKKLIYNLGSAENNNQGTNIKLQFYNNTANSPIVIHGWSILWEPLNQAG